MLQGMKEPCGKGESDSILTLSLADVVARRVFGLARGFLLPTLSTIGPCGLPAETEAGGCQPRESVPRIRRPE